MPKPHLILFKICALLDKQQSFLQFNDDFFIYLLSTRLSVDEDLSISLIHFELLKLKHEYQMKKLFSTKHDDKNAAELATLRFKIRMIEAGIKQVD